MIRRGFSIVLLAVAFTSAVLADRKDDDYWQFEKWLQYVHQAAPQQKVPWREQIYANDNTYDQWMDWYNALPREARRFPGADKAYWKQWYQRGFSPDFALKNTNPKQEHTFSRPLLRGEKSK